MGERHAEKVGRGLVAGKHQPGEHRKHLEVSHLDGSSVTLVPHVADEVVTAVGASLLHEFAEMVMQVEEALGLLLGRPGVNVLGPQEEAECGADPLRAGWVDADQAADDSEWERQRERRLEVTVTLLGESVDEPVRLFADPGLVARQSPRHEEGVDAGAEAVVVGIVDPDQGAAVGHPASEHLSPR